MQANIGYIPATHIKLYWWQSFHFCGSILTTLHTLVSRMRQVEVSLVNQLAPLSSRSPGTRELTLSGQRSCLCSLHESAVPHCRVLQQTCTHGINVNKTSSRTCHFACQYSADQNVYLSSAYMKPIRAELFVLDWMSTSTLIFFSLPSASEVMTVII